MMDKIKNKSRFEKIFVRLEQYTHNTMEKQFAPFYLAFHVKELGFNKPCIGVWNLPEDEWVVTLVYNGILHDGYVNDPETINVAAPLWQQIIDWFRDEHKINIETPFLPNVNKYGIVVSDKVGPTPRELTDVQNILRGQDITNNYAKYDDYNDAREAAILKAIGMLQDRIKLKKFMEFHMGDNQNEEI